MLLAIDAGNAEIKCGVFDGDALRFVCRMAAQPALTADQYAVQLQSLLHFYGAREQEVAAAVLSSVAPSLTGPLSLAVRRLCGCKVLTVGPGVKTGLNIKTDNPAAMGADFVCGAVGALSLYPPPLVVFDFGTATTVTALDGDGALVGRAIMAGVQTALDALCARAACLPQVRLARPEGPLGKNTAESMVSGAVYGAAAMVDGLAARYRALLGERLCLVLTGGLCETVLPCCMEPVRCEKDLVLWGLKKIHERNRPGPQ